MPTVRHRRFDSFSALPPGYARLFDESAGRSFCLSLPWFCNFVESVNEPGQQVVIYGVEATDRAAAPVAALPMRYATGRLGLTTLRTLRPLANYYASLFGPILSPAHAEPDQLAGPLVQALLSGPHRWDAIDLTPMDTDAPSFRGFERALQEAGFVTQRYFAFANWYLQVSGRSYAGYLGGLPSVLRKNIPYYDRKIQKSHRVRYEIVRSSDGVAQALDAYDRVYRSSWKQEEPYPRFIPGFAHTAAKHGWLRLGVAYLDEVPAAAQLWIVTSGTASIFKVAYDERFSKTSVGTVLTAKLMEHVLDIDKVHTVDFLSGDDSYKRHWMSHRRERWGLLALNPRTVKGAVSVIRHVTGRAVKRTAEAWMRRGQEAAQATSGSQPLTDAPPPGESSTSDRS
jgi:CelD/BcsL family acetyltransferase involved in cellulose biosynthesis